MKCLNHAYLMGELAQDPERKFRGGERAVRFRLRLLPESDTCVVVYGRGGWADWLVDRLRAGDALALDCRLRPSRVVDARGLVDDEIDVVATRAVWMAVGDDGNLRRVMIESTDFPPAWEDDHFPHPSC